MLEKNTKETGKYVYKKKSYMYKGKRKLFMYEKNHMYEKTRREEENIMYEQIFRLFSFLSLHLSNVKR